MHLDIKSVYRKDDVLLLKLEKSLMNILGDRRVSDIVIADVLKTNCLYENIYFWTEGDNGPTKFYLFLQAFNSQVSTAHANIPKVSHIEENREQDSERKVEEHVAALHHIPPTVLLFS